MTPTPTRPNYSLDPRHEAMREVLSIRNFARRAGVRRAATALARQGLPLPLALAILVRNPINATGALVRWRNHILASCADENLGDC